MKVIKYQKLSRYNLGTEETPDWREGMGEVIMGFNGANQQLAEQEAYNGEYTIEEVLAMAEPSRMDAVEAQATYTAMMTDTLLEV